MPRKTPPSFDFYPDDFASGVANLNTIEVGAYMLLLCFQWGHGFVPSDEDELRLITRLNGGVFDSVWAKVSKKFVDIGDGMLANERMQLDRESALVSHAKRVEAGRKGGSSNAKAMLKQRGKQKRSIGKREGGRGKKEVTKKKRQEKLDLPEGLDTPEFRVTWSEWEKHRTQIGKPLTPLSVTKQLKELSGIGHDRAVAMIEHTIAKGWQGLRESDEAKQRSTRDVEVTF